MPAAQHPRRFAFARSRTMFVLQGAAYAFVIGAGAFWLLSPSTIAVNQLGPYVTPVGGTVASIGATMALYGHLFSRWLPEQVGAVLVAFSAGLYAYSIAIDSISDSTKGMGMCVVSSFFFLCLLRILQIERYTDPRVVGRRLAANRAR